MAWRAYNGTARQVKGLASSSDTATWAAHVVNGSDTLVMYTYGGDATLDGKINVDDYGRTDFNVGIQGPRFFTGGGGESPVAVPEPASLAAAFVAAGATMLSRRRSRRTSGG